MAITPTYVPLATVTLASADGSVDFTSIPQSFSDLILVANYGAASAGFSGKAYLNADTTPGNYTSVRMVGNGSTYYSSATGESIRWEVQATANSLVMLQIMDYSATNKHKTVLVRASNAGAAVEASVSRWNQTTAVDAVRLAFGTNFTIGSTFSLYGVN
jgi:hypothetical protein